MTDQTDPLVSIIIPTYNRASIIEPTLNSVLAQTYPHWECLVVDDFSTDNTEEVLGRYAQQDARFKYLLNQRKKGGNGARNTGLLNAAGEWLIFLDSDDLLLPHCLKQRVGFVQERPELDFAVFDIVRVLDNGEKLLFSSYTGNDSGNPSEEVLGMFLDYDVPWCATSPLWKRESLIEKAVLWNEELKIAQDYGGLPF